MQTSHGYSAGHFVLELDGEFAGYLKSVEGGEAFAAVAEKPPAQDGVIPKRLTAVKYEPIRIKVGGGMTQAFCQWMAQLLVRAHKLTEGAILLLDKR